MHIVSIDNLPQNVLKAYRGDRENLSYLNLPLTDVLEHGKFDLLSVIDDNNAYARLKNLAHAMADRHKLETIGDFSSVELEEINVQGFGKTACANLKKIMKTIGGVFANEVGNAELLSNSIYNGVTFFTERSPECVEEAYHRDHFPFSKIEPFRVKLSDAAFVQNIMDTTAQTEDQKTDIILDDNNILQIASTLQALKESGYEMVLTVKAPSKQFPDEPKP